MPGRSGIGYRDYVSGGTGNDVLIGTVDRFGIGYGNYASGGSGTDTRIVFVPEDTSVPRIDATILDGGLTLLDTFATTIWICSQQPTSYGETITYGLGYKSFAAGAAFGSSTDYAAGGRQVSSTAFNNGEVIANGVATHWAVTTGARLYVAGKLNAPLSVASGILFQLPSFKIVLLDGGGIEGVKIGHSALDGGLNLFAAANKIVVCSQIPTTYDLANTNTLGTKNFGAGHCFGAVADYADGRKISSVQISDGDITVNGTPVCWAALDDYNLRLLAVGDISGAVAMTAGERFRLDSFTIDVPGIPYVWQPKHVNLIISPTTPMVESKSGKFGLPARLDVALSSTAPTITRAIVLAATDLATAVPSLEGMPAFSRIQGPLTIEELFGVGHPDQLLEFSRLLDPATQKLMTGGSEVTYQVVDCNIDTPPLARDLVLSSTAPSVVKT